LTGHLTFFATEAHVFIQGRWLKSWFFCEACGRAFETKREAVECCRWGPSTTSKKVEAYTCLGCGRGFVDYQTLRAHIEEHERRALDAEKLHSSLRATEAVVGYEPGEGHLISCDRCGALTQPEKVVSLFYGPRGEKVDLCVKCFSRGEGARCLKP
jgi:hypothetical protein